MPTNKIIEKMKLGQTAVGISLSFYADEIIELAGAMDLDFVIFVTLPCLSFNTIALDSTLQLLLANADGTSDPIGTNFGSGANITASNARDTSPSINARLVNGLGFVLNLVPIGVQPVPSAG